jgi:hypothetical protein
MQTTANGGADAACAAGHQHGLAREFSRLARSTNGSHVIEDNN